MKNLHAIQVNCDPQYTVTVGSGLLSECGRRLRSEIGLCTAAVITDSNVAPLYLPQVTDSLKEAGFTVYSHIFPAGEANKNLHTFETILEFLAESRLTRTDCVIALGGGVCGDITGFAAGCYLRGIRCVQLPTTLLAAVDSSVGGKTAVDLHAGKNLAGVFLQPSAVICDTDCLQTLSAECLADGMAEIIKTGILSGEELFESCSSDDIAATISRCVEYKASVVEQDPFENGMRKLLNLGHTAGHAIEKCSDFSVTHGHAVAAGTAIIARASRKLGWCPSLCCDRIIQKLRQHHLPVSCSFSAEELAQAAQIDKKRAGDSITLVIPEAIGSCSLKKISVSELEAVFHAGLEKDCL